MNILKDSLGAVNFFTRLPKWAKVVSAVFAFTSMHNYALLVGLDAILVRIVDPTFFAPVLWEATASLLFATMFVHLIQVAIVVAAGMWAGFLWQVRLRDSYSAPSWGRVAPDYAINLCILLCFLLFYLGGKFVEIFAFSFSFLLFLEVMSWLGKNMVSKRKARWKQDFEQRPIRDRIEYLNKEMTALEGDRIDLSLAKMMLISLTIIAAAITAGTLKADVMLRSSLAVRVVLQDESEFGGGLIGKDRSSIFISQNDGVRAINWSEVESVISEGSAHKTLE